MPIKWPISAPCWQGRRNACLVAQSWPSILFHGRVGRGTNRGFDAAGHPGLQAKGVKANGPVQGDAALNPTIGTRKGMAGLDPNVLLFPNLDAGNIAYKLAQELAGATALGPLMHASPTDGISRGASAEDIVGVTLLTALMELG